MKNKRFFLVVVGAILATTTFAQDHLQVKTDLENVTVFTNSAELNHKASVNLPTGSSEIIFTHVASDIDENTIQIGSNAAVTILSVRYTKNYITQTNKTEEYIKFENIFKKEKNKLIELENAKETEESVLKLLEKNQKISSENSGTTVAELIKMTEYYQPKYLKVKNNISRIEENIVLQAPIVQNAKDQLEELKGQTLAAGGQLVVQVMNSNAGIKPFTIAYLASSAGWNATYDIRADDLNGPVHIIYKANVSQNTGVDWNNVRLRLSSGNPSQGGILPVLQPWQLYFNQPFTGYIGRESTQILDEVSVVSNIKRSAANIKMSSPPVVQTENQMHTSFDIELPYTIISNGKKHAVVLREYQTPASYKYVSTPRVDQDVYLTAELTDYEKLNLIPGESNIFVENTMVGRTYIDPNNTSDTLQLSMGRDKLIQVKRELIGELSQTKVFGNNKTQRYTYEISLKNNKKTPISVKINDQYPLSTDKAMEIELLDRDGAIVNSQTGILTWDIDLAPGETKKVKFSYSIKFPKNKLISHY